MKKQSKTRRNSHAILRNLIILAASIGVVVVTQLVRMYVSADPPTSSSTGNKYMSLITGDGDFEVQGEGCSDPIFTPLDDEVDKMMKKYHAEINCKFNTKIRKLTALGKTGDKKDLDKLVDRLDPPPQIPSSDGLPKGRQDCKGEDLSTYCLAIDSTKEFFDFRDAMIAMRRKIKTEMPDSVQKTAGDATQRKMAEVSKKTNRIDDEIAIAQKSLDQGLAAYNEFQMALPMHMKYMSLIKGLEGYRDKISAIRKEVEIYPATFLNVSTTKCT